MGDIVQQTQNTHFGKLDIKYAVDITQGIWNNSVDIWIFAFSAVSMWFSVSQQHFFNDNNQFQECLKCLLQWHNMATLQKLFWACQIFIVSLLHGNFNMFLYMELWYVCHSLYPHFGLVKTFICLQCTFGSATLWHLLAKKHTWSSVIAYFMFISCIFMNSLGNESSSVLNFVIQRLQFEKCYVAANVILAIKSI